MVIKNQQTDVQNHLSLSVEFYTYHTVTSVRLQFQCCGIGHRRRFGPTKNFGVAVPMIARYNRLFSQTIIVLFYVVLCNSKKVRLESRSAEVLRTAY